MWLCLCDIQTAEFSVHALKLVILYTVEQDEGNHGAEGQNGGSKCGADLQHVQNFCALFCSIFYVTAGLKQETQQSAAQTGCSLGDKGEGGNIQSIAPYAGGVLAVDSAVQGNGGEQNVPVTDADTANGGKDEHERNGLIAAQVPEAVSNCNAQESSNDNLTLAKQLGQVGQGKGSYDGSAVVDNGEGGVEVCILQVVDAVVHGSTCGEVVAHVSEGGCNAETHEGFVAEQVNDFLKQVFLGAFRFGRLYREISFLDAYQEQGGNNQQSGSYNGSEGVAPCHVVFCAGEAGDHIHEDRSCNDGNNTGSDEAVGSKPGDFASFLSKPGGQYLLGYGKAGVGHIKADVGEVCPCELCTVGFKAGVSEQKHGEYCETNTADKDIMAALTVAGLGSVQQNAHQRIVNAIPYTGDQQQYACGSGADAKNVGEVEHKNCLEEQHGEGESAAADDIADAFLQ